jgi:hypothetical protein
MTDEFCARASLRRFLQQKQVFLICMGGIGISRRLARRGDGLAYSENSFSSQIESPGGKR